VTSNIDNMQRATDDMDDQPMTSSQFDKGKERKRIYKGLYPHDRSTNCKTTNDWPRPTSNIITDDG